MDGRLRFQIVAPVAGSIASTCTSTEGALALSSQDPEQAAPVVGEPVEPPRLLHPRATPQHRPVARAQAGDLEPGSRVAYIEDTAAGDDDVGRDLPEVRLPAQLQGRLEGAVGDGVAVLRADAVLGRLVGGAPRPLPHREAEHRDHGEDPEPHLRAGRYPARRRRTPTSMAADLHADPEITGRSAYGQPAPGAGAGRSAAGRWVIPR